MKEISEQYKRDLLESIPVVSEMNLEIKTVEDQKIVLKAPLNKNINYEGTAFGGSINTLAILSCYLLTHHTMKIHDIDFKSLVIQNSEIDYLMPVDSDFEAVAEIDEASVISFIRSLKRRKVGRLNVLSQIMVGDSIRASFKGRFVATL